VCGAAADDGIHDEYHLCDTMIMLRTLDCLRFTYGFEKRPAEVCHGAGNAGLYQPNSQDTPLRPWLLHQCGLHDPLGPDAARPEFGWASDGLSPVPGTVREMEAAGAFEGDTGHSSRCRPGATIFSRRDAKLRGVDKSQTMKESLDRQERASLLAHLGDPSARL
jgi:hypothetical protein